MTGKPGCSTKGRISIGMTERYGYELEPVDISDVLSFVESREEVYGNKPKVNLSMYGDAGKWHADAAVSYKGRESY
ncbi:hypothetical protein ACI2WT_09730 [Lysinibacillus fusiformis]